LIYIKAGRSFLSSVGVKNEWSCDSTPPIRLNVISKAKTMVITIISVFWEVFLSVLTDTGKVLEESAASNFRAELTFIFYRKYKYDTVK
jgi:hypothetical protein